MTEDVIQYVWNTQSFDKSALRTTEGLSIKVFNQGIQNIDSGPDFSSARVIIDDLEWVGDIEIHKKTSCWKKHNHHLDALYNKVVLHVVWEHDHEAYRADGSKMFTLELKNIVSEDWVQKCTGLLNSIKHIPCDHFIEGINDIYWSDAFSKALVERLERKSNIVLVELEKLKGNWEQTSINLLFEYFGFKKNNDAFRQLAITTDYRIINKLATQHQIEAYLFGMAGLLEINKISSTYKDALIKEFSWIKNKFNIKQEPMSIAWWKFMRLRPANFPTLRIAQLAALLYQKEHFFQSIINGSEDDAASFFQVQPSEFWHTHYHFNKVAESTLYGLGEMSRRILSINVAAVLLVAYGRYTNNELYLEKAIRFLETQKPEANSITRRWNNLGVKMINAAESQGAIELFNNYCSKYRCLRCNIGNQILQGKWSLV